MGDLPEEVGKVTTSAIDAMKGNPSCLAAIILAGLFAGLTFWGLQRDADRRSRTVDVLLTKCIPYVEELKQESHPRRDEGDDQ